MEINELAEVKLIMISDLRKVSEQPIADVKKGAE